MKIKKITFIIATVWIILIGISLFLNYTNAINEQKRIAFVSAKSFFDHLVITRRWNATHGGPYVPVTEKTPPNPYLDVPMRDIEVNSLKLTKINPAYMTRLISEIAMEYQGVKFHLTSLKTIRPQNKPTPREEEYLKEFEKGIKEVGLFIKEDSKTSFFYMAPLQTEKLCLQCHSKQGYKEGDIRGGISVTLPFVMEIPLLYLIASHIGIGVIGLLGIILFGKKLNISYEIIKKQAALDSLTGIPNRRIFLESILQEFKRSRRNREPLAVIMCDIDKFKAYNDTYGHIAGDLCLKKVAQGIKDVLKRPGDFCARYGGEEFIAILPNTPLDGAMHIAEKIRAKIEGMKIEHEKLLPLRVVSLSLGVAVAEEDTNLVSHEEIINYADKAMYKAKDQGMNQVQSFSEIA
jgi:diguanylate cyclase (GGDEF)-like protein